MNTVIVSVNSNILLIHIFWSLSKLLNLGHVDVSAVEINILPTLLFGSYLLL